METRKQLPLLQEAERRLRRRLLRIAVPLGAAALLLVGLGLGGLIPERGMDFEIYRLLLQFVLITAAGGVLLAIVGNARDVAIRRQALAAEVYKLDRELDGAFRALRTTKHRLRAHGEDARPADGGAAGPRAPAGLRIRRAPFEAAMEDLLDGKQKLEGICEHIGHRNDVLFPWRLDRMKAPLDYAKLYYHDVYRDFELGGVALDGDHYLVAAATAPNLTDYLRDRGEGCAERPEDVDAELRVVAGDGGPLEPRAAALARLIEAGRDAGGRPLRYADVAGACIALLAAELADARRNLLS